MRAVGISAICLAFFIQSQSARAGVIFDNGMNPAIATGGLQSDFDSGQYLTDNFNLTEGFTTIRDIHWLGVYGTLSPDATIDDFTFRFYNTDGGPVQNHFAEYTGLSTTRTNTGFTVSGLAIYEYSTVIPDLALTAGPTYWLSVVNDTSAYPTYGWSWVRLSGAGDARVRFTTPSGA